MIWQKVIKYTHLFSHRYNIALPDITRLVFSELVYRLSYCAGPKIPSNSSVIRPNLTQNWTSMADNFQLLKLEGIFRLAGDIVSMWSIVLFIYLTILIYIRTMLSKLPNLFPHRERKFVIYRAHGSIVELLPFPS